MIKLCFEYLSVRCIRLCASIMSYSNFGINVYSKCLNVKNSLLETGATFEI